MNTLESIGLSEQQINFAAETSKKPEVKKILDLLEKLPFGDLNVIGFLLKIRVSNLADENAEQAMFTPAVPDSLKAPEVHEYMSWFDPSR